MAFIPALREAATFGVVTVLTAAVLIVAVVPQPPLGADLWVYSIYGRIIVEHGGNPYEHPPSDYPEDPWVDDLLLFRDARNFYGPGFTAMTAAVAAVGGDSRLPVRLAYQIGAGLAVMASLTLLIRGGATVAGAAAFSLNPVIIVEVVSQGRMDAYIGLALIAAAVLASRRRPHLAALAIAAGTLVKIPAGLALIALAAWVLRRYGVRKAVTVALTGVGTIGAAYIAFGGKKAIQPLIDARDATNDVNIWVLARENGWARALGDLDTQLGPLGSIPTLASVAAIALGALVIWARWDDRNPALLLAVPVLAYLLTSTYPSSWYIGWILPLLALQYRSRAALIGLALFSVLFVRQTYYAAVVMDRGEGDLASPLIPAQDRILSSLYPAAIMIEVVGIVILSAEAIRRGGFRRRKEHSAPDRDGVGGAAPRGASASNAPGRAS